MARSRRRHVHDAQCDIHEEGSHCVDVTMVPLADLRCDPLLECEGCITWDPMSGREAGLPVEPLGRRPALTAGRVALGVGVVPSATCGPQLGPIARGNRGTAAV